MPITSGKALPYLLQPDDLTKSETSEALERILMRKEKIFYEGQPCRLCGNPVVKRSHNKPTHRNQAYWFKGWFYCEKCGARYMIESEKIVTPKT
jgi:uncharacterized protein with PIN domain